MASTQPHTNHTAEHGLGHVGHLLSAPFAPAVSGLAVVRRRLALSTGALWLGGMLLLGGIGLGVLISAQLQARGAGAASDASPLTHQSDPQIVASTISRLEAQQYALKNQIADLRTQLSNVQDTDANRKTSLVGINNEIARQRAASGLVALHGPGIIATFDDSTVRSIPENEDPANYILHDYDLRDMLNALWIAGAEAVSLNGERIVGNTSLYCVGTTIICNATRLSPPYEIHAIGAPKALADALESSPQMTKFNRRAQIYDLPVKIEQNHDVQVSAYSGSFAFKYANSVVQQ